MSIIATESAAIYTAVPQALVIIFMCLMYSSWLERIVGFVFLAAASFSFLGYSAPRAYTVDKPAFPAKKKKTSQPASANKA
jgi:hypothetical protein